MSKTTIIVMLVSAVLLLSVWIFCWYNKDRYQYIHHASSNARNATTGVLDKNTGVVYDGEYRIDYPNAKTLQRKFKISHEE